MPHAYTCTIKSPSCTPALAMSLVWFRNEMKCLEEISDDGRNALPLSADEQQIELRVTQASCINTSIFCINYSHLTPVTPNPNVGNLFPSITVRFLLLLQRIRTCNQTQILHLLVWEKDEDSIFQITLLAMRTNVQWWVVLTCLRQAWANKYICVKCTSERP